MNGINALFHWGSAVAAIFLVILLLRVTKQRDLLRRLLAERRLAAGARKVHVETPRTFLKGFAATLAIPFEAMDGKGDGKGALDAPARIDATPLLDLFLSHGITLIRCTSTIEIHLPGALAERTDLASPLRAALGGNVEIVIVPK